MKEGPGGKENPWGCWLQARALTSQYCWHRNESRGHVKPHLIHISPSLSLGPLQLSHFAVERKILLWKYDRGRESGYQTVGPQEDWGPSAMSPGPAERLTGFSPLTPYPPLPPPQDPGPLAGTEPSRPALPFMALHGSLPGLRGSSH